MCDCFHLAFPNWHAASSGTGAGRRLRGPEAGAEDDSICDEPAQFTEGERPRPQGSSPVEEYPETEKYSDSDKECEAEHDPDHKSRSGKKTKKSGLGSMFEKRSTPKMSKLKEVHSPESGVIVKTAKDGCAEGLIYGGGGKEGIFIKEVVPESPASKSLKLKEGDQILSATVYFDNVSYEDAIQILEHAQAYKVKLCLKRKPDITEDEPTIDSDVIPEEELYAPEMREQGKTKRRGDARISWPKFPSFGKGRKSRFTRSHSSSEADEQRKLELSPTTSDTESPIKSQDALKGKKRLKMKLSVLKKRGRISSSEDQDTDTPPTGQISGKIHEASDMLSPECLESPSGETAEVYVTEELKVVEDLRLEQNDQKLTEPQTVQHKVELITIDSTLKTEDLTVALADKESTSGIKSPDGKKKKKERSEIKMKILGKDKSHKKDTKAKASPKRLKTLGASIEIPDQPENEKSDVIPSFESHTNLQGDQLADSSRVTRKSPQKGEEKMKKGKDIKHKQETKTGPLFKLPKIGLSDIATEETIQKMNVNVEEYTTKIEQHTTEGTEVKEDPYERLSSRAQLPKREEIEIPGMEDMSLMTRAKGLKEPEAGFMGHYDDLQAETVQLSIDVNSVKEAVSKLPGYKLPKVDMSGMPIPEDITVIDANAQRISVKTPTKVVDTKTKHETHFTKFDITASPEISKTTVKLPKIPPAELTSEEFLIETKVDFKNTEKKHKSKAKQSDQQIKSEVYKREDIIIPGKESAQAVAVLHAQDTEGVKSEFESAANLSPKESDKKSRKAKITTAGFGITKPDIKIPDIGIYLPKQNISKQKGGTVKGEETVIIQEVKISKTETRNGKGQIGGIISDVRIPEIDGIEYIDSVGGSPGQKDGGILLAGFDTEEHTIKLPKFGAVTDSISVNVLDADKDINIDGAVIKTFEREGKGGKFKMPNLDISMPKGKGSKIDSSLSKKDVDVKLPEAKAEVKLPEVSEADVTLGNVDVSIPKQMMEVEGQGGKFKMPKFGIKMPKIKRPELDLGLSKKDVDVTLPDAKVEGKLPEAIDGTLGSVNVSISQQDMKIKTPELEIKPLQTDELDGQGSRFKMPKLGIAMPKVKGPEVDFSFPKKDRDVPEAKANITIPEDANISVAVKQPESEAEMDGQGSKFKMPKFGISMPKVKGPEIDFSLSKKDIDVTLPEAKVEAKIPDVELKEPSAKVEIKAPEFKGVEKDAEGSPSKFKMPTLKLPKFGGATPNVSVEVSDKTKPIQIPETQLKPSDESVAGDIKTPNIDIEGPSLDVKTTAAEIDGKGSKFKMPTFGISMPKVKGPDIDLSLSKKDVDVTLPKAKAEVKLPEVEHTEPDVKVEVKAPEIAAHEGSPSKFKMPTFKLPKFGVGTPHVSVKVPDMEKDVKIDRADINIPEEGPAVDIEAPNVNFEGPSIDIKTTGTEQDGKGSKFKMPHLGFSMPKVKGPKTDLRLSKKDVDVTLPEAKVEVALPKVDLGKTDISIPDTTMEVPEAKAEVKLPEAPTIAVEMKAPEIEAEMDGHGGKFKIPKFGIKIPKVKGSEFDLSLSKKDKDVKLPETKADIKLPEVELRKADVSITEAKMEVKKPELEMQSLQIEGKLDGQGERFKMPKFGIKMPKVKGPEFDLSLSKKDIDVTLPQAKVEVKLPEDPKIDGSLGKAEAMIPGAKAEVDMPELEIKPLQTEVEGQGSKFKMPKFGMAMPKIKGPEFHLGFSKQDVDVSLGKADVLIPEGKVEVEKPEVEIKPLQTDVELEGQGGKFKMPKFGMAMPKVKGPEIDLSFSKTDVDVTIPEAKAEVKLPEAPEIDVNLERVDVPIPEAKMEIKKPGLEVKPLEFEGELDGQGSKFKMPKFGMSMPKVKGPEIDFSISKKDVDITLPETKADINLPDVELKEPSAKVEIKAAEIETPLRVKGSPSKFKMPTFKFPKFGVATPNVSTDVPDIDKEIKIDGADMHISVPHTDVDVPEVKTEVHLPEIEIKEPSGDVVIAQQPGVEIDAKMKKPRFSLPRFSFSKPGVKAPDVDVSIPDVNVAIPEGKVEMKGGEVDMKPPECEAEVVGQGSKFKLPKFGITMPKVTGPEIDLNLSKKDVDMTLPEAKAQVKLPDVELKEPSTEVEIKAPQIKVVTKDTEGSPSKFKMPTFELPKFGFGTPSATVEVPDMDKDIKIDGADIKIPEDDLTVDIAAPSIVTEGPSIHMKTTGAEHEGKGSKFKMPSLSFSVPQVKRPDIDLSLSKKDVDVTLPEAKAESKLPDVELKQPSAEVEINVPEIKVAAKNTEGSPSKFKMPTFKLPKFGVGIPSATVEVSDTDKNVKIDGGDIKVPEEVLTVGMTAPSIDTEVPSIHMKTTGTEHEEKGSKFKMPSLSFSVPQVKRPDIDLSLSKKDVDVTLPEAEAEIKLPDVELKQPSAEVEIKAPEIKVAAKNTERSPSKFKMPTFKLPKFGVGIPHATAEVSDTDKDLKINGGDIKVPEEVLTVGMTAPSIDTEVPSIHMKTTGTEHEEKGSKFKMPSLSFSVPQVKQPDIDLSLSKKDVDVTLPEAKAEGKLPDVELKQPSAEVEIKAPEIKVAAKNTERSPSKFKMPTFKLPKFGVGIPHATVEVSDTDKDLKINGGDIEVPEEVLTVGMTAPSIDTEVPSIHMETTGTEHEEKGSKFKMQSLSFSVPQVKRPDIDLSLSKKDVDVTLPEAEAEIKLPDVELKQPSAEVEIKAPEIKVAAKNTERSPSKFKMPTFKLPKFGVGIPTATAEVSDTDKDLKINGGDIEVPEEVLTVGMTAPSIDNEGPSIHMKTTGTEHEGKGSKFKMPSLGFSVKRPDTDLSLSKKDVDVTLPEAEAEIKLPDVELKQPSAEVEIKAPGIDIQTSSVEGSPSKFKMPTFKLPKFGAASPQVNVEVADVDRDIKVDGEDLKLPQTKAEVKLPDVEIKEPVGSISVSQVPITEGDAKLKKPRFSLPKFSFSKQSTKEPVVDVSPQDVDVSLPEGNVEVKQPEVELKPPEGDVELHGQGSKFKMPKFGISMPKVKGPEIDLSLSKKDVDVTLPEAKAKVQLTDVKIKQPSAEVEIKAPEIEAKAGNVEGSPSKLKMPTFTLPKFGAATPKVSVEVPGVDKDINIDESKLEVPMGATVDVTAPSIDSEGLSVNVKAKGSELEGSGSKFKMPSFGMSLPKVKGPEIDLSLSKKDVDVTIPETKAEVKLPSVEVKEPEGAISAPDAPTVEVEATMKRPDWTFPKFSFSRTSGKAPEVDVNLETPKVNVTSPEAKAEASLPDAEIQGSLGGISMGEPPAAEPDTNLKKSKFSLPRFSFSKSSVKEPEVSAELPHVDVSLPEGEVKVQQPDVELKPPEGDVKLDVQESKFKIPKFGISVPKAKAPEIDLSLSKKDVNVTLPEAKAEVQLPDVKIKQPSAKVEIKAPEIEARIGNVEGSSSKLKMPTFTLPKFGATTPKVSVEVSDVDKDINIEGSKLAVPMGATMDVTAPSIETKGLSVDVKAKGSEPEGSGSKFKMPNLGISMPKVKGPEIDLSLSKKDVDVTIPETKAEVKLPSVKVKEPEVAISVPDAPTVEVEAKSKRPNWTFPKFSFSRTSGKAPDADINLETPKVEVKSPEAKAEISLPDVKVQGSSVAISTKEPSAAELDATTKTLKFSLPRFSFSKSSVIEPEDSAELPHVDVSLPEGEVKVQQPEMEIKTPELEVEHGGQGSKFKLPKFGIALPQKDVDITLPEVKAEVKLPESKSKSSASVEMKSSESEAKSKDVGGSPLKFKMPKFGSATYDVTMEAPDADKVAETDGSKLKEDVTVNIKGPTFDIKTDLSEAAPTDTETAKIETDSVGLGSPSKFKLPSFKMPKLSFSRPKPEEEYIPVETESKEDQLEMEVEPKGETKSPKKNLTSFGDILKNIDVEFDVSKTDKEEDNLETSKEVLETGEPSGKQLEPKQSETNTKQDTTKSPERTGWFKFPKFGLSSPSEPAKISGKGDHKDEKSPGGETVDEEISPTCSVHSSDAFADVSSAMNSEHVGLSLSSPTKVTVKYSDPNAATGLEDIYSNVITSTTRTELISVEPNLPEKITILSSGVSSSSEDTLRLESGKIHVITSNIQATPEAQHAKLLTAVQVQSAGGLPLKSEAHEAASRTVGEPQSGKRTVFERHLVKETSSERSESRETIVITQQITHSGMFDSSEPISGETASSIQRLKDSVHSEKMRFFDGAKK